MSRPVASIKSMWIGRAQGFRVGLATIVALVFGVLLCSGITTAQTAPPPTYTIKDLGTLPDYTFAVEAYGIDDSGRVVGHAFNSPLLHNHAFLYSAGQMTDLGTLGGTRSRAAAVDGVDNSGPVVGSAETSTGETHAFLYRATVGQMTDLGTLGGNYSAARSIDDAGLVVGESETATGQQHAFLSGGPGTMIDLGTLPGGTESHASDINASNQVVGLSDTEGVGVNNRAFLYSDNQMTDLGTLGGAYSRAHSINDSGQVVGLSSTSTSVNAEEHAFLYSAGGQMTDLGTLGGNYSDARSINNSGQIVGSARTSTGDYHVFLYSGGQMQDLNTLIPAGSGWTLHVGTAINNAGQIIGYGFLNGERRSFVATPTTPPKVKNNTSPANNATGVSRTANVTATFSEPMDEASVEAPGVVTLKKSSGGAAVAASVTYNPTTRKVILNPNLSLARNTLYSARVTTGARDLAGNQLDQNATTEGNQAKSWKFTTVQ